MEPVEKGYGMTLDSGVSNSNYRVEEMKLPLAVEKRLESLGMTRGTQVHVLNNKDGGTLIVKVRGSRLALGKGISKNISASLVAQSN